ncbi:MAG: hypothetical protein ACR2QT_10870 [Woeseiaceae bacterium]
MATSIANAQDWRRFVDHDEFFAVNVPGEPEVSEFLYASEWGGNLPAKLYRLQAMGVDYRVTVVNYGTNEKAYVRVDDHTDDDFPWLYDFRGSIAYAAHNIRKRGGKVTFDAWHHIEMVEGHQLHITHEDGSRIYASMYLYEDTGRLYILEANAPAGALPQGLFQQSLNFLDEDGNRVRYLLKPDGSQVRREDVSEY